MSDRTHAEKLARLVAYKLHDGAQPFAVCARCYGQDWDSVAWHGMSARWACHECGAITDAIGLSLAWELLVTPTTGSTT